MASTDRKNIQHIIDKYRMTQDSHDYWKGNITFSPCLNFSRRWRRRSVPSCRLACRYQCFRESLSTPSLLRKTSSTVFCHFKFCKRPRMKTVTKLIKRFRWEVKTVEVIMRTEMFSSLRVSSTWNSFPMHIVRFWVDKCRVKLPHVMITTDRWIP